METNEEIRNKIKNLIDKGDVNSLFEAMGYYAKLQDDEAFSFFVDNHQEELLKKDPILFIGSHIDYYLQNERLSEALSTLEIYRNAPYISMEVEDFMKDLKQRIESEIKKTSHKITDEDIEKALFSKKEDRIMGAINYLSKQNIRNYLPLIKKFLSSDCLYKYKAIVLLMLTEQKVDGEFVAINNGEELIVKPYELDMPFDYYPYIECKKIFTSQKNHIEVIDNAVSILNTIQIKTFPNYFLDQDNYELVADIIWNMALKYHEITVSNETISNAHHISLKVVNEIEKEFEIILNQ